jgi:hypothetical protein
MHQIAQQMPELEAWYTPYYGDGFVEAMRKVGMVDFTILGWPRRRESLRYIRRNALLFDYEGRRNRYDLVVTCSDVIVPANVQSTPLVGVQEGMTDPPLFWYWARRLCPLVPRWTSGTAWTGTSNLCDRFCVASEGYRDLFISRGAEPERLVVTGIPNFDNCERYRQNDFPHRDFALVCTSDARETLKFDNRRRFLKRAVKLAGDLPIIFKLHPNEDWDRARREIERWAPGSLVLTQGKAEEMVANCRILVCQYSTLAFVGLALGKEVHSHFNIDDLRRLLPLQGGLGASNIARVCREVLGEGHRKTAPQKSSAVQPVMETA